MNIAWEFQVRGSVAIPCLQREGERASKTLSRDQMRKTQPLHQPWSEKNSLLSASRTVGAFTFLSAMLCLTRQPRDVRFSLPFSKASQMMFQYEIWISGESDQDSCVASRGWQMASIRQGLNHSSVIDQPESGSEWRTSGRGSCGTGILRKNAPFKSIKMVFVCNFRQIYRELTFDKIFHRNCWTNFISIFTCPFSAKNVGKYSWVETAARPHTMLLIAGSPLSLVFFHILEAIHRCEALCQLHTWF